MGCYREGEKGVEDVADSMMGVVWDNILDGFDGIMMEEKMFGKVECPNFVFCEKEKATIQDPWKQEVTVKLMGGGPSSRHWKQDCIRFRLASKWQATLTCVMITI